MLLKQMDNSGLEQQQGCKSAWLSCSCARFHQPGLALLGWSWLMGSAPSHPTVPGDTLLLPCSRQEETGS